MTLLPMENRESILCALKNFSKEMSLNIPPILEDFMHLISRNGQTMLPWVFVKPLILQKYKLVIENFHSDAFSNDTEELKQRVFGVLKRLDGIPFTIQRICELLCAPNRHYTRLDKYLRGLEKVCRVVSTVDPRGNKIHHEDPRFPSQAGLEVCMTDDSLLSPNTSPSDGDEVTDEDGDNVSSGGMETLLESAENVVDVPLPTPASPMWQMTSDTTPVPLGQTTGDPLITSPPPDEVEPPLLRPIGQLEAFVQNIAAEIPVSANSSVPIATSVASSTNGQSLLVASSIASIQMEINEDGDGLEMEEPDDETAGGRSLDDSGDDQHPDNELSHRSPVAGFKRRASVSVDEALASSLGSLVEQEATASAYLSDSGGSTPVLEQAEQEHTEEAEERDHDAAESPAKRRRIAVLPAGSEGVLAASASRPRVDTVESSDLPSADLPSPSSSPSTLSNCSPPAIVCSRPDASQPSTTDNSSSSRPADAESAEVIDVNSTGEESAVARHAEEESAAATAESD